MPNHRDDKYKKYGLVKAGKEVQPGGSMRPPTMINREGRIIGAEETLYKYPTRPKKSAPFQTGEDDATETPNVEIEKRPEVRKQEEMAEARKKADAEKRRVAAEKVKKDEEMRKAYIERKKKSAGMMGERK